MRVLLDTNIVLDTLLGCAPHAQDSAQIVPLADRRRITSLLCATTLTTLEYLLAKPLGTPAARTHIATLLQVFEVALVDGAILREAADSDFTDFEDAVLHAAPIASGCDAIITRDRTGFRKTRLPVYTPSQFLDVMQALDRAETP